MATTHTIETADVDLVYDVHGPLPTADGRRPLLMVGQPMDAGGFATLASHFADRTAVTYYRVASVAAHAKTAATTTPPRTRRPICTL